MKPKAEDKPKCNHDIVLHDEIVCTDCHQWVHIGTLTRKKKREGIKEVIEDLEELRTKITATNDGTGYTTGYISQKDLLNFIKKWKGKI